MTLPVSDDVACQIAACDDTAYLVIPAVPCICPPAAIKNMSVGQHWARCTQAGRGDPDPVWVALAEATCDTCDGKGVRVKDHPVVGQTFPPCPARCWEGRPVHQLTTECDQCGDGCSVYHCCVGSLRPGGVVSWDHLCDVHREHQGFHDCAGCCEHCDNGRRVLGEVTVTELVPIFAGDVDDEAPDPHIRQQGNRWLLIQDLHRTTGFTPPEVIDLIGDPVPGDWVAILNVRSAT